MSLSASDRAVLFNSDSVLVQMQKFMVNRPGHKCKIEELRSMFFDISLGCFYSSISVLKARKVLLQEGQVLKIEAETVNIRGTMSDSVWRAIRILKIFTVKKIQEILPDLKDRAIRDVVKVLASMGAIERIARLDTGETVYKLISDSRNRPIHCKVSARGSKANGIWSIVESFGGVFTSDDIRAHPKWSSLGASSRYVDVLIRMWRGEGLLIEISKKKEKRRTLSVLKIVEGAKRCPVYKHYKEGKE